MQARYCHADLNFTNEEADFVGLGNIPVVDPARAAASPPRVPEDLAHGDRYRQYHNDRQRRSAGCGFAATRTPLYNFVCLQDSVFRCSTS